MSFDLRVYLRSTKQYYINYQQPFLIIIVENGNFHHLMVLSNIQTIQNHMICDVNVNNAKTIVDFL